MKNIKKQALQINTLLPTQVEKLHSEIELQYLSITSQDLSGQLASAVSFNEVSFNRTNLSQTQLTRPIISNSVFQLVDFSNAQWFNSSWIKTDINDSKLLGFQANQARLRQVEFIHCQMVMSQWQFVDTRGLKFMQCELNQAHFNQAELRGTIFKDCDLSEADFSAADMRNVDIRGSKIDNIKLDIHKAKGMIVDPAQALYLARLMGLVIEV